MNTLPILNWVPKHDERSKSYPIRTTISTNKYRIKVWTPGEILDQKNQPSCVGYGWTAEALATPIKVDLTRVKADIPRESHSFATFLYNKAKTIDEWEGENYSGTSVIAGAKAMQSIGLLKEYRWAFSINDVILSLIYIGPVVLGIYWYESMYEAPNGILTPSGMLVGGHCLTAIGFYTSHEDLGGDAGILLQNSWGREWGKEGLALIRVNDLNKLLLQDGEACVPFKRSYGR